MKKFLCSFAVFIFAMTVSAQNAENARNETVSMVTTSDMIRRKVYFTVFTPIQPTMRSDKIAFVAAHIIMLADN